MDNNEAAELYNQIRSLMGYVQNSSDTSVTLSQDDATYTYHIRVGNSANNRTYWGNSFAEVIRKAVKDNPID